MTQDEAIVAAAAIIQQHIDLARRGGNVDLDVVRAGVAKAQTLLTENAPALSLTGVDLTSAAALDELVT